MFVVYVDVLNDKRGPRIIKQSMLFFGDEIPNDPYYNIQSFYGYIWDHVFIVRSFIKTHPHEQFDGHRKLIYYKQYHLNH